MLELSKAIAEIADMFNDEVEDVKVYPHQSGVWGNSLYEIITPTQHLLYKQFNSFEAVDINYNPPAITAENRLNLSVAMQNMAFNTILCKHIEIPMIRLIFQQSFVMDYLGAGSNLKSLLDKGQNIPNLKSLGKAIAKFHNISRPESALVRINDLVQYKIEIQYNSISISELGTKAERIYKELYSEVIDSTNLVPIHGDFNAKNIIVNQSETLGIVDFEHSGLGNRIYDLSYFIADIMITIIIYPNKLSYCQSLVDFVSAYIKESGQNESYFSSLWGHTAVQMLYRINGPSANNWTGYFSKENLSIIRKVGIKMLSTNFTLGSSASQIAFFID